MASTLLNAVITAPIYAVNSKLVSRTLYPYGQTILFGSGSINIQPNSGTTVNDLEAARVSGAALVYSRIKSAATGDTVFFSNLTIANILTQLAT